MAKSTNSQSVINAEANLQTAKMLEGISNLRASIDLFDKSINVNWNTSHEKAINDIFKPILNLKEVMLAVHNTKKNCALNENIKLVEDITKGIQLKAKYEMRISELELSLEVANTNNAIMQNGINELKKSFKELIDKIIDKSADKDIAEAFMIKFNTNIMEKSINYAVKSHLEKILKEKKCEIETMPF